MKIGVPSPGKSLGAALKATYTYQAFRAGQMPPVFDENAAMPATLTYRDRNGVITDRVLLDQAAGLMLHIHSIDGDRKIAFLDDVPSQHISVSDGPSAPTPTSNQPDDVLTEGQQSSVTLTVYERNPVARRRCIEHYGASCCICNFSFSQRYGERFGGYIHVHHLIPVSTREAEYEVDPIDDLRPVCPNCHVVIHSSRPPLTIEAVKEMVEAAD